MKKRVKKEKKPTFPVREVDDHFLSSFPTYDRTNFALLAQNSPAVPEIVPETPIFLVRLCQMLHADAYDTVMVDASAGR